jgi:hypothetical protein
MVKQAMLAERPALDTGLPLAGSLPEKRAAGHLGTAGHRPLRRQPLPAEELGICKCGPGLRGPFLFMEYFCHWHAVLGVTREGTGNKKAHGVAHGFAMAEILHL